MLDVVVLDIVFDFNLVFYWANHCHGSWAQCKSNILISTIENVGWWTIKNFQPLNIQTFFTNTVHENRHEQVVILQDFQLSIYSQFLNNNEKGNTSGFVLQQFPCSLLGYFMDRFGSVPYVCWCEGDYGYPAILGHVHTIICLQLVNLKRRHKNKETCWESYHVHMHEAIQFSGTITTGYDIW